MKNSLFKSRLALAVALALAAGASVAAPEPATKPGPASQAQPTASTLPILAYHDIVPMKGPTDEPDTVSVDSLVRHFSWIQAKGYTPVTLAQVEVAAAGGAPLPPKAILLTFDDGYASVHTYVLPLLRAYKWPAVVAIIGSRLDPNEKTKNGPAYLSPAQLRELADSGLVDFANHSFDLHHGVIANAWGNAQPSAVTRIWKDGVAESDSQWRERIRADLTRNQERIYELTGKYPTMMVWPYGRYNGELQSVAKSVGLSLQFTLEDGLSDVQSERLALKRHLVGREDLEGAVAGVVHARWATSPIVRAMTVRAEDLISTAQSEGEAQLSRLVTAISELQGSTLVMDPFIRKGDQVAAAAFPTSELQNTVNYTNRAAVVTTGKAGYAVWLSIPLSVGQYPGLSQAQILQVVEDAAKATPVSGLLVEDADLVSADVVREARARLERWRSTPTLALRFTRNATVEAINGQVAAAGASYVWLTKGQPALPGLTVPAIFEIDPELTPASAVQVVPGHASLALTRVPNETKSWVDIFSLRSTPRNRIDTKAK